jgi:hypothetical protein
MGVEFRLSRNDHRVVETFLVRSPQGVAGIQVEARHRVRQQAAIEAALAAGIDVTIDPMTERLTAEGYNAAELDYHDHDRPLELPMDMTRRAARENFVERVVEPQLEQVTLLTPPHFFVEDDDGVDLNIALIRATTRFASGTSVPVRPILAVQRSFIARPGIADLIARRYAHEGVSSIDLRLSPVGGDDDGAQKIRSALDIAAAFSGRSIQVLLGRQGALGASALALGLADRFSVGIGMFERFDHKSTITRQSRPGTGGPLRGPQAGVYVGEAAVTLPRRTAQDLFDDPRLRSRIACRVGHCATDVAGPVLDPRGHYLHARANDVVVMRAQPAPWRANMQRESLMKALEVRRLINRHLPAGAHPIKNRTLTALVGEIELRNAAAA